MSVQLLSSSNGSNGEPAFLARAEAVLCDMDGTLVDSSAVVESMWSSFARDHGMSERFDEIMAYSPGRTGIDTIRRFLPDLASEEHDAIHERFAREEIVRTAGRMAEIPGAAALVTALIDAGVPLALVTSAPIELMRVRMEEAGVPIPAVVVSADDVARGKPDPDAYLKAAELLGVPIGSCLVLEDAASGYTAAQRAGAQVLLVGDGVPDADPQVPRIPDFTGVTFAVVG
ncbi:HAD-IA family hydrolase [Actinomyces sp. ZJ308]|uniref:HAD family hydrolase n=1 Tax=Actinomyces sp. ZJ308 TaxID=2708342 RepID=UPI001422F9E9|nr:HAD-IA family hydrolase [Actinomyces sp. ZJ308]